MLIRVSTQELQGLDLCPSLFSSHRPSPWLCLPKIRFDPASVFTRPAPPYLLYGQLLLDLGPTQAKQDAFILRPLV